MLASLRSAAVLGVEALAVIVEVDVSFGLPVFTMVGLPDASVRESRDRVRTAIRNSGFEFPGHRITVNLAPADIRKAGASYDLPIALGVLAASGVIEPRLRRRSRSARRAVARRVDSADSRRAAGCRGRKARRESGDPAAARERTGGPGRRRAEGAAGDSLVEAVEALNGGLKDVSGSDDAGLLDEAGLKASTPSCRPSGRRRRRYPRSQPDFADVIGQSMAKRALEIAAAGGHNVLLIGAPGGGKTMMARRLAGILPPLEFDEALDCTSVHSVAGTLPPGTALMHHRPFRAPHHTISEVAMVGGGSIPRPGEISLAHNGVLFLDELPEFDRRVLESAAAAARGGARHDRARGAYLVLPCPLHAGRGDEPCPCGFHGDRRRACRCSDPQIQRYGGRISGPLRDRIDLVVEVPAIGSSVRDDARRRRETSTQVIRARVR